MGTFLKYLNRFTFTLVVFIILLYLTDNEHLFKALGNTYMKGRGGPSISEREIFESRELEPLNPRLVDFRLDANKLYYDEELLTKLESYDPAGILILYGGDVLYERYWGGYSRLDKTNSFSVAKSIVGLAMIKAIELEIINSLDEKVIDYVPELEGDYREDVTIKHLLQMTSGIDFDESYGNPFGFMAKAYYGDELIKKTLKYEAEDKPGDEWKYSGGNTILLAMIVNRAAGMTISEFVSKHIWKNIGAENSAYWNLDAKGGMEKAYCCFYASPIDFAKLGLMILNQGKFYERNVFAQDIYHTLNQPVVLNSGEEVPYYSLHFWRINHHSEIVYARGILGQYIVAIPELDMVVVRIGHDRGEKTEENHPKDVYTLIDFAYSLYENRVIKKRIKV